MIFILWIDCRAARLDLGNRTIEVGPGGGLT